MNFPRTESYFAANVSMFASAILISSFCLLLLGVGACEGLEGRRVGIGSFELGLGSSKVCQDCSVFATRLQPTSLSFQAV